MQTFLPYPCFAKSLACLDYQRLNKQRIEASHIYKIITGLDPDSRWRNHPAVNMWRGFPDVLGLYYNLVIREWKSRGYKNNMNLIMIPPIPPQMPKWLGRQDFHASHRSNLLRKDPEFYGKYGWIEPPDLPYVWPINKRT